MNNKFDFYFLIFLLIATIIFVVAFFSVNDINAETKTVVHSVVVFDTISKTELRSLFSGKLRTFKGVSFTIFAQSKYSNATIEFCRDVLNFSVEKFYSDLTNWSSAGYAMSPRFTTDDYSMILNVSTTPYSIGYASSGIIYQNLGNKIKILKVE